MYSNGSVAVDKGLGFDFSAITDLVKSALPVGLNIFQQQQQLKAIKSMGQANVYGGYNVPTIGLPAAQMYGLQPTFGQPGYMRPQSSMFDTGTMLMIGGVLVGGLVLFKMLR